MIDVCITNLGKYNEGILDYERVTLPDHSPLQQDYRELTSSEKKGIKDLITTMCANYDNHYDVTIYSFSSL